MIEKLGRLNTGINNFLKTDNQNAHLNSFTEFKRVISKAVQEDKLLLGVDQPGCIGEPIMYFQRMREFGSMFTEIFLYKEYEWEAKSEFPRIIDLGGDIGGFTVLYWKSIAPNAQITLVEANPATANTARENFHIRGLQNVEVINGVISEKDGGIENLYLSGYNPSNFAGDRNNLDARNYHVVPVRTLQLSKLIGEDHVDLLKMDIEGAENGALRDLNMSGKLQQIDEIMMEFHNDPNIPNNSIHDILSILNQNNFSVGNLHVSGIERTRKLTNKHVDLNNIKPTDKLLLAFTARKKTT